VVGPVVFGAVAEHWSYAAAWGSGSVLLALAAAMMLAIRTRILERPPAPIVT